VITLHLSDQEIEDVAEALDSPDLCDLAKKKLLVITMHHEGARHGLIARCLRISSGTLALFRERPTLNSSSNSTKRGVFQRLNTRPVERSTPDEAIG
jgi:hypothetical protein